jgi:hypothetical protein
LASLVRNFYRGTTQFLKEEVMKYIGLGGLVSLFFLLAACSAPAPSATGTLEAEANYWQQLGGNLAGFSSLEASLALDTSGNPTVSWTDSNNIYVKRWTGNSWQQLGGILNNTSEGAPSLALDASGNPTVAQYELNGTSAGGTSKTIYVKRWDGSSWVQLGGILNDRTNLDAQYPSLALDAFGAPVVAWQESDGSSTNIYVKYWDGLTWLEYLPVALDVNVGFNASEPSLALDSNGNPVVAWYEELGGNSLNIYVKRWNGSNWVQYGAGGPLDITPFNTAYGPSLALDSNDNPAVAWAEFGVSSYDIYVKQWTGSSWVQRGTALDVTTNQPAISPSLALDSSGNPVVSWQETDGTSSNIYVKQWSGSSWTLAGNNPLDIRLSNQSYTPSLGLVNGSLAVAWTEGTRIYVKKYISNAWQDLGGALDFNSGQSATNSSIARKNTNIPVVAWDETDSSNGSRNVYVKEWTGSAWTILGGALDRTLANDAENPSLVLRSNLPVVAFQEANNIYVRRWTGTAWGNISSIALDTVLANDALTPSLALDTGNLPAVAYAENGNILVKKANGIAASSLWTSPYGTTPLDNTVANETYRPSLAFKSDNNPIVAWYEDAGTSFNIYAKEWNGTAWVALGTTIDKTVSRDAKDIVLAIRTDNRPVVAWEEAGNIYVKRWTGTSWVSLGNTLDKVAGNEALRPSLDLRSDNNPVVTWQEFNGSSYDVFVKRWTGSSWAQITVNAVDKTLSRNAERPSLVLKSGNNPIISWDEEDGTSETIFVRQF